MANTETTALPYKRILLKLSGEAFAEEGMGVDIDRVDFIARKVVKLHELGVEMALVIGAGNLWRGAMGMERGMNRSTADHMGMIATVMNGLALRDALERVGVEARVQTAVHMNDVAEPYIRLKAIRHMEKGRIVILAGGTGNPYFTTDSAAALRASEVDADIVIKATKVNGIYDSDPKKNPDAVRYETISYDEVLAKGLRVMDMTAFTLCKENDMPILVLDFGTEDDLINAVKGDSSAGTLVTHKA
ncbi:MAG: UMP kinase [Aggregatilineales bacterium]